MSYRFQIWISLSLGILFSLFAIVASTYQQSIVTGFAAIIATMFFGFAFVSFMVTKGFSLLFSNLIKNNNHTPIIPAPNEQGENQDLNTPGLTPDQQKFVNHYSLGALSGSFYFIYFGMPKEGLKNYIPLYNITHLVNYFFEGRKMVWENVKWDSFETYKKRQILADRLVMVFIGFIVISIILLLILR